eukprot:c19680_g2_i9.p1 GENE.c19680_g2_i9~~c19680_g2_i9.p1  ORF type:complete len:118 (-),score=6.14 c19680_g2_i9:421-774(-)
MKMQILAELAASRIVGSPDNDLVHSICMHVVTFQCINKQVKHGLGPDKLTSENFLPEQKEICQPKNLLTSRAATSRKLAENPQAYSQDIMELPVAFKCIAIHVFHRFKFECIGSVEV